MNKRKEKNEWTKNKRNEKKTNERWTNEMKKPNRRKTNEMKKTNERWKTKWKKQTHPSLSTVGFHSPVSPAILHKVETGERRREMKENGEISCWKIDFENRKCCPRYPTFSSSSARYTESWMGRWVSSRSGRGRETEKVWFNLNKICQKLFIGLNTELDNELLCKLLSYLTTD